MKIYRIGLHDKILTFTEDISNDVLFENMDDYVNGNGAEGNKKRAGSQFLEVAGLDMEELKMLQDTLVFFEFTSECYISLRMTAYIV